MLASLTLAIALAAGPSGPTLAANAPAAKIVFLPEDFTGGYDHRGGGATLLAHLEKYVAVHAPGNHVRFDLRTLLRNGVEPYYIYDKRYCSRIGAALGANVFVMGRLTVVEPGRFPDEEPYDVEAKAFSSETGREVLLLRASRVRAKDLRRLIAGKEEELLRRILSVAESTQDPE